MFKKQKLTKTRFKIGLECPRKLRYDADPNYVNQNNHDAQLQALAEEGMKVGEYAKLLFPNGIEIEGLDREKSLEETNLLLKNDDVVLFEAAIEYKDTFIRVDILEKKGASLNFYEVKSKSYSPGKDSLTTKNGMPNNKWQSYLYDAAFQKYVVEKAFPAFDVTAHLTLINKASIAAQNGINGSFRMIGQGSAKHAVFDLDKLPDDDFLNQLVHVNVDKECNSILASTIHPSFKTNSFEEVVDYLSNIVSDKLIPEPVITASCGKCQFQSLGLSGLDGRLECLNKSYPEQDLKSEDKLIFDLWNYRGKQSFIDSGILRLRDIPKSTFDAPEYKQGSGLSDNQRQLIQWEKVSSNDPMAFVDSVGLSEEISKWTFPLHFIDFETARGALPYFKGQKPNDLVAFQFSHHVIHSNGDIEHKGQFLDVGKDKNPNLNFIRELKSQLSKDAGTVFSYSDYEMKCLSELSTYITSSDAKDADELIVFIDSLVNKKSSRAIVDLLEVYKSYIYLPKTNGSNSIKDVLPAVLNESKLIRSLYCDPIYGKDGEIKSLNFSRPVAWLEMNGDEATNPYALLPILDEVPDDAMLVKNGGAAQAAYSLLQTNEIDPSLKGYLESSLLQYCELDTLAMVMIYQYFQEVCSQ